MILVNNCPIPYEGPVAGQQTHGVTTLHFLFFFFLSYPNVAVWPYGQQYLPPQLAQTAGDGKTAQIIIFTAVHGKGGMCHVHTGTSMENISEISERFLIFWSALEL